MKEREPEEKTQKEEKKMSVYRVPVYDYDRVIAWVKYNSNLDYWNGRNWTCGGLGLHKGLAKLKDGRYILIHGTDWQGERDWGEIISPRRALEEVIKSGNTDLLEQPRFKELKELAEQMVEMEEEQ